MSHNHSIRDDIVTRVQKLLIVDIQDGRFGDSWGVLDLCPRTLRKGSRSGNLGRVVNLLTLIRILT